MQSEFACGDDLMKKNLAEDDLESLVIQQIEFCNIILLNKASEVTPEELGRVKSIIRALLKEAFHYLGFREILFHDGGVFMEYDLASCDAIFLCALIELFLSFVSQRFAREEKFQFGVFA